MDTQTKEYINLASKTWEVSEEKYTFIYNLVSDITQLHYKRMPTSELAKYIINQFVDETDKQIAAYEYGKLISATILIRYFMKQNKRPSNTFSVIRKEGETLQ